MAKKIQISDDAGVTYFTFPGDTGTLSLNGTQIKDTVFGQDYESEQPGMINWTLDLNGYYKGFAGYVATLKMSGTSTLMTTEACSLVSGKTYQITNAVKRTFDRTATLNVFDNGVNHNADVISIDYLFGRVTFAPAYTVTGPVTITANYLPLAQIAKAQSFTLTQTAAVINKSDFVTAQANSGLTVNDYGLKTFGFDLSGFYSVTNAFRALLLARSEVIIEIGPDGGGLSIARGFFKPATESQSGKVGELEVESLKFVGFVPDPSAVPLMPYPFSWLQGAGTTLSTSIQKTITAWQNKTLPLFKYLYDGTNGVSGAGVVTDISLTGGLDVMNTFAIKIQGSDTLSTVGTG